MLVAIGTGLGIWFGVAKKDADDARSHAGTTTQPSASTDVDRGPTERDPIFKPMDSARAVVEVAAMRAVYALCSKHYAFREGSTLSSIYVAATADRAAMINVSVDLHDSAKARGNTLWYAVQLDGSEKPVAVTPQKDVSAELCGLTPGARVPL